MIGREPSNSKPRDWDSEEWDRVQRRSLVWPVVATFMTALAVGHVISLKRRLLNFERHAQQARSTMHGNGNRDNYDHTYRTYDSGRFYRRESFSRRDKGRSDEPWSRMWREGFPDTDEFERLERIRRMQAAFFRERANYARSYEKWQEGGRTGRHGDQESGREDWYWGREDWEAWCNANRARFESPQSALKSPLAHHYDVLGLDVSRAGTYSQDEIKAAFRAKAMQYHPDRNQHRKDVAEAKFREALSSYEALKK